MISETLGSIYGALARGHWLEVRDRCREHFGGAPESAAVQHAIGLSFCGEGRFEDALPHLVRAHRLDAANPRWARDLGAVHAKLGRWSECVDVLSPVVGNLDSEALSLLLTAAVEAGGSGTALALLEEARRESLPADAQFRCAYGVALAAEKRYQEAVAVLTDCLALNSDIPDAHEALSFAFEGMNEPERAFHHAREYARLRPDSAHATIRLALACSERGLIDEARCLRQATPTECFRRSEDHSAKLFMMLSDPQETAGSIVTAARRAYADLPPAAVPPFTRRARRSDRRLRLGYVSGECRATPAYYFFWPFLPRHDRACVEVFLYCCNSLRDHLTPEYQQWPEHWRDYAHLADPALVDAIRGDDLDVVVDLSGHFIFNRLWALAGRVAPVQMTYPNYPGTTGCPEMDYILTDVWTTPPGTEDGYSEQVYRLECGYLMYAPPAEGPRVGPQPLLARQTPTFGIFQRLSKFNPDVWDAVAAVLVSVPDSRLLIQNGDRELDRPESSTAKMLRGQLEMRGIDPGRMTLKGPQPYLEHLSTVTQVDVALDTFPYNGQTTTCESLWMGVPVVTMPGSTHVSRVSSALLTRAGYADWIADSVDSYVAIVASLVDNPESLAAIRRRLRHDVVAGGLTDGGALVRALEHACRSVREV